MRHAISASRSSLPSEPQTPVSCPSNPFPTWNPFPVEPFTRNVEPEPDSSDDADADDSEFDDVESVGLADATP